MAWLFVPGVADLKPDCILSCPASTGPYVLLKGKPTQRPVSWTGWKKRAWARRLCGMMLPHSTLTRGMDLWISSLWASRANPTLAREKNLEKMTRAISGLMGGGLFAQLDRLMSSAKTSKGCSNTAMKKSGETWNTTAIRLQKESLQRNKLAHRIFGNDYSISQNFPTPNTVDAKGGGRKNPGKGHQVQLCHVVKNRFPTPAAAQAVQGQNSPDGKRGQTLIGAVRKQNWATPTAHDAKGKGRDGQLVTDVFHGRGPQGAKNPNTPGNILEVLNPDWEEHLMGWIPGQSAFTCSEKVLSLWRRQWRLFLFGVN